MLKKIKNKAITEVTVTVSRHGHRESFAVIKVRRGKLVLQ